MSPGQPRRFVRFAGLSAAIIGAVAVVAITQSVRASHDTWASAQADGGPEWSSTATTGFSQASDRETQIRVWHQALDADPTSALVLGQLAALHAQRAREGGMVSDYTIAEQFARRSLAKRTQRNGATAATLVSVLLAQHRFRDAYTEATTLRAREFDIPQYRALLGEVAMENGDYATARSMFDSSWTERGHLSTAPRLARWLEVNGHLREAHRTLVQARADAMARGDVTNEAKAWFCLRLGDLELRSGRPKAAAQAYREGLVVEPHDPRLHAAMARGAASEKRWQDAIAWGEQAIALQLDVATLAVVADAYQALGDTAQSAAYTRTVQVTLAAQEGPQHRAGSLFLLDRGIDVQEIRTVAERELEHRKDIYGYDLAAWALYRSGQPVRAAQLMEKALSMRTIDPLLAWHANAIADAARAQATDSASRRTVRALAVAMHTAKRQ